jgi:hypothetical protein
VISIEHINNIGTCGLVVDNKKICDLDENLFPKDEAGCEHQKQDEERRENQAESGVNAQDSSLGQKTKISPGRGNFSNIIRFSGPAVPLTPVASVGPMKYRTTSVALRLGYKRGAILALLCGLACAQDSPGPPRTLATFEMEELFGVGWQSQPIEFRYDGGRPPAATTRMIGPGGGEVPWQWVSSCSDASAVKGCILVRSDLPAHASYKWTLETGAPPSVQLPNGVKLTRTASNYEVTNGLTGIRISSPEGNPRPVESRSHPGNPVAWERLDRGWRDAEPAVCGASVLRRGCRVGVKCRDLHRYRL